MSYSRTEHELGLITGSSSIWCTAASWSASWTEGEAHDTVKHEAGKGDEAWPGHPLRRPLAVLPDAGSASSTQNPARSPPARQHYESLPRPGCLTISGSMPCSSASPVAFRSLPLTRANLGTALIGYGRDV